MLYDAAALASNLTSADSLVHAASLELALLRAQRDTALQLQASTLPWGGGCVSVGVCS